MEWRLPMKSIFQRHCFFEKEIYQLSLGILEPEKEASIRQHLENCVSCQKYEAEISEVCKDVSLFADVSDIPIYVGNCHAGFVEAIGQNDSTSPWRGFLDGCSSCGMSHLVCTALLLIMTCMWHIFPRESRIRPVHASNSFAMFWSENNKYDMDLLSETTTPMLVDKSLFAVNCYDTISQRTHYIPAETNVSNIGRHSFKYLEN